MLQFNLILMKNINHAEQAITLISVGHCPETLRINDSFSRSGAVRNQLDQQQIPEVVDQILQALIRLFPACINPSTSGSSAATFRS